VAERQILFDAIGVGWIDERHLAQRAASAGLFGLEQMPAAGAPTKNFPRGGYLETFRHRFPGFNAFRASHKCPVLNECCNPKIANKSLATPGVGNSVAEAAKSDPERQSTEHDPIEDEPGNIPNGHRGGPRFGYFM